MPVELERLLVACKGTNPATNAFFRVDNRHSGIIVEAQSIKEAPFRAGPASSDAVVVCVRHKIGLQDGIRIVPAGSSPDLGTAAFATKADHGTAAEAVIRHADKAEVLHFIKICYRLLSGNPLSELPGFKMQGKGPHKDAGFDGKFVLAFPLAHFFSAGPAGAGNQRQLFSR
jgi:hypothetical protein